jgi:hypothetical protein
MTWSLNAFGHAPDEAAERELADRLSQVLADPKYGAGSSSFGGTYVHGDLRTRENWLGPAEAPDAG